jgi:hypothetical protein
LKTFNRQFEPQWQSLKLLKEVLLAGGVGDEETAEILSPLLLLHNMRSKVKGHAANSEKQNFVKLAKTTHGSLPAHFRAFTSDIQVSFDRLVKKL